jgi:hypothetical protein
MCENALYSNHKNKLHLCSVLYTRHRQREDDNNTRLYNNTEQQRQIVVVHRCPRKGVARRNK